MQRENINTSGNLLPDVFIEGDFKRDIKKYFLFYYSIYQARENFRLYRRDYSAYSISPCQDMIPPIFFTFWYPIFLRRAAAWLLLLPEWQ